MEPSASRSSALQNHIFMKGRFPGGVQLVSLEYLYSGASEARPKGQSNDRETGIRREVIGQNKVQT